jgi:hypothetical protein
MLYPLESADKHTSLVALHARWDVPVTSGPPCGPIQSLLVVVCVGTGSYMWYEQGANTDFLPS